MKEFELIELAKAARLAVYNTPQYSTYGVWDQEQRAEYNRKNDLAIGTRLAEELGFIEREAPEE